MHLSYGLRLPTDVRHVPVVRHLAVATLRELGVRRESIDAIALAVTEACTNVVRHAYPFGAGGEVEVTGRLVLEPERRRLAVTVRDQGTWRPEVAGQGYGLRTMRACMERVTIRHGEDGTAVTLISKAVPAEGPDGG